MDTYTLPVGVNNLLSVEVAQSLTEPYLYYTHRHWVEKSGKLRFDHGYAPTSVGYKIRLTYRLDHVDLVDDEQVIPVQVNEEALFWRALIELLSMLMTTRLPYHTDHVDLVEDEDMIPDRVDEDGLFWRALIELLSMLLAVRPKKQHYLDLFTEAQTEWRRLVAVRPKKQRYLELFQEAQAEWQRRVAVRPKKQRYLELFQEAQAEWQRRVVMPPQRSAHLAGW